MQIYPSLDNKKTRPESPKGWTGNFLNAKRNCRKKSKKGKGDGKRRKEANAQDMLRPLI